MPNALEIHLPVPHVVELDGYLLLADTTKVSYRLATPEVFNSFVELDYTDEEEILKFAKKWGTFGLCAKHQVPAGIHRTSDDPDAPYQNCEPRIRTRKGRDYFAERIAPWQGLIQEAGYLRRLGASVAEGRAGTTEELRILSQAVQKWLDEGRVRPSFNWNRGRHAFSLRHCPSGQWQLFGWLALRLAVEVAGGKWVVCPFCRNVYFPRRMPTPGKGHHCSAEMCRRAYFTAYKRKQRKTEE
jgi:hypothetical protein